MINIEGLNKAELLKELYNRSNNDESKRLYSESHYMTISEASLLLESTYEFHYVYGKPIFMDLSKVSVDESGYDSFNGIGATLDIVESLRNNKLITINLTNHKKKDEIDELNKMKYDIEASGLTFHLCYSTNQNHF